MGSSLPHSGSRLDTWGRSVSSIRRIEQPNDLMRLMLEASRPLHQVFTVEEIQRSFSDLESGYFGYYEENKLKAAFLASVLSGRLYVHDIIGQACHVWDYIKSHTQFLAYVRQSNGLDLADIGDLTSIYVRANSTQFLDYHIIHQLFNYVLPQEDGYVIGNVQK